MDNEFDDRTEASLENIAENSKILVTGGCGYLGSILTEMLIRRNFEVTVIDNLNYAQNTLFNLFHKRKLNFIYGDVTNEVFLKKVLTEQYFDFIFPLAGIVGFPISEQKPEITWLVNYQSIVNLLKYRDKESKIIFPTTNSGYGSTDGKTFCTEEQPLNPISVYGKSKVEAEKKVMEAGNAISLRLATLFGFSPRMRTDLLVNDFVYKAVKEKAIVLFERNYKRNFLHVRDAARCFLWCMTNWEKMKDNVYNVGHPDYNLTKEELCLLIKKKIPDFNIFYAEIGSDPDKRNYIISNEKILKTGFKFKYTVEDGIEELIAGYNAFKDFRFRNY